MKRFTAFNYECSSLASLSSLAQCLPVIPEPTKEEHLFQNWFDVDILGFQIEVNSIRFKLFILIKLPKHLVIVKTPCLRPLSY
jgi:hypothetical protein